jgi:hypothetical protein
MTTITRKDRYDVGDRVELYPEPTHEGPHPSDADTLPEYAIVTSVDVHPNNDEYVLGYGVETLEWPYEQTIKPGKIARLAPELVVHYFEHGTSDAYGATQTRAVIRDGDVLVVDDVLDENADVVVGFLAKAWPVALTETHGAFHTIAPDADITKLGAHPARPEVGLSADPGTDYTRSVELARQTIAEL